MMAVKGQEVIGMEPVIAKVEEDLVEEHGILGLARFWEREEWNPLRLTGVDGDIEFYQDD
jgi:hypothetical protein